MNDGLSEFIGSWKIIAMRSPRMACISRWESFSRSWPSNRISPAAISPGGVGISRNTDSAVTLLPDPDSPTSATVSPGRDVEADVVHGGDRAAVGAKARGQAAHGQQGLDHVSESSGGSETPPDSSQ